MRPWMRPQPSTLGLQPRTSGIVDDAASFLKESATDPTTLLHLVPFMGWTNVLLGAFEGWGVLGKAAELGFHAAPGIVRGESVSDALVADYGTRLKIAAGVALAPVLASASAGAGAVLASSGGLAAIGAGGYDVLDRVEGEARRELGDDLVDQAKARAGAFVEERIARPFVEIVSDEGMRAAYESVPRPATPTELEARGLDPASIARARKVREDAAALAINVLLHERVYGVTPRTYDPASGARIMEVSVDRTSGKNSAWALIDLLEAEKSGAPPDQIASLRDDLERAQRVEQIGPRASAAAVLIEVLRAEQRGADPTYVFGLKRAFEGAKRREDAAARRTAAAEASRASALRGEVDVELPKERPTFELKSPLSLGRVLRGAGTLAVVVVPAWITWLRLRRR